jgi:hypothetical protein
LKTQIYVDRKFATRIYFVIRDPVPVPPHVPAAGEKSGEQQSGGDGQQAQRAAARGTFTNIPGTSALFFEIPI